MDNIERGVEQGIEQDMTGGQQQGNVGGQQQGNSGGGFNGMKDQVADGMVNHGMLLSPLLLFVTLLLCPLALSSHAGKPEKNCVQKIIVF